MKLNFLKRVMGLVLTFCLVLTMIPISLSINDVEAVSGVDSLTCSSYISNSIARNYIDKMMRYYINNNSSLRSTLDNGLSVVFMFEGGSDNYWSGSDYTKSDYDVRNQAVCIVVKKDSSGNAKITFVNESSCSIPGDPTWCTGASYSGSTTLMDGIYSFYTWNHTGPYAAFQCSLSSSNGCGYYTPPASPNGYQNGASGINIHTRSTNIAGGQSLGWVWSAGCQLISYGGDTGNEFNNFMKAVCGITWNSWINYSSKTFNTWASSNVGITKGYYVVDRQLGLMNSSGTKYGSGSLINLYNKTALTNITAKSTAAASAAGADKVDYLSQCTYYPSYNNVKITANDVWTRTLPCYSSTDSSAATVSQYNTGDTLTVTGVYKNTIGECWYRVTNSSGTHTYFNAAYAEVTSKITSDIKFTGHNPPTGHPKGTGYVIDGDISTQYNRISNISAYVYEGLGTSGSNLTGTSVNVSTTSYKLAGSAVDEAVWMSVMDNGPHTLHITMKYDNYYVTGGTTVNSNGGTVVLASDYFMVIPSSVSQSSCSHTYKKYTIKEGTCTTNGESWETCTTCGLSKGKVTTTASHSYGDWVVTNATCVTEGSKVRTCTKCGNKETQTIPYGGHNYTSRALDATCVEYKRILHTCSLCGDSYSEYADALNNWSETKPADAAGRVIETKEQYRYATYSSATAYTSTLDGYTLEKSDWEKNQTGTVNYVKSWPTGFNTSNSLYSTYNKTPKTAVTNTNDKTVIDSDKVVGYLYYHWCYDNSYYSVASSSGNYTTFHAYYSTTNPSTYVDYDLSDMSYRTSNSCCSNSEWFFVTEVNQQQYTTYKKLYTFGKWSDWSQWSDTPVTATDTKKVETRTLYRSVNPSDLGAHTYVNGVCTGCQKAEPDFYLFGYINGADYACEADAANIGIYKFENGKLKAEFTENSYVAFKTGDNQDWYMTDGYAGDNARSAVFYNTNKGINAEKLFVPKGIEVEFTLVSNGDGSYTLSYVLGECDHKNHNTNGNCTICGEAVGHTFENGACTVCGKAAPAYYLFGFINGEDYYGAEYRFIDGTLTTKFAQDSYIAVRLNDNSVWYMTDGYLGEEATTATLYDAAILGDRGDKLFVPGGKFVNFTLVDNGDSTFTLSYSLEGCAHTHHNLDGKCTSCGVAVAHAFVDGECSICGFTCTHEWGEDDICVNCSKEKPVYCLFGFVNGEDYDGTDYVFVDGTLTATFTDATYVAVKTRDNSNWYMTDGYQGSEATSVLLSNTKILDGRGDKLFIPRGREITFTLTDNGNDTFTLSYVAADCQHEVHNINGVCLSCGETVEHNLVGGNCTVCGNNCMHDWVDGICTKCNKAEPVYFLAGFVNGYDYSGDYYRFNDGILVTSFSENSYVYVISSDQLTYMTDGYLGEQETSALLYNSTVIPDTADKLFVPGNREVIFTLVDNGNNTLTLAYNLGECKHTEHSQDGVCSSCGETAEHNYVNGYCSECSVECAHSYSKNRCTICGVKEPDYYLFGTINGSVYACDEDAENIGIYKFVNGKLTVLFSQDSFVAVKTGDNLKWYMTDTYQGIVNSAVLYNTNKGITADKLFIPGGRMVTLTLVNNGDDTFTLSYEVMPCEHKNHSQSGICYACAENVEHSYVNGICTVCSAYCKHEYTDGVCSVCGISCTHLWLDGVCSRCELVCDHTYENGTCTVCAFECIHEFTNGVCSVCSMVCEHNWIGGACYKCHEVCDHNFKDGVCTVCNFRCYHNYSDGVCTECGIVCTHKWNDGNCLVCDKVCNHTYVNSICTVCNSECKHNFVNSTCTSCQLTCTHKWSEGKCTVCTAECTHKWSDGKCTVCSKDCEHMYVGTSCAVCSKKAQFYLVGNINGSKVGFEEDYLSLGSYAIKNGTVSITTTEDSYVCVKTADNKDWYMADQQYTGKTAYVYNIKHTDATDLMFIPAGVKAQLVLIPYQNDSFKVTYFVESCTHTYHDTKGKCIACSQSVEHTYAEDVCTVCSAPKPMKDMYLYGIINGADYGYNADMNNIGTYKFVDKKLTVTFAKDSYVAIKSYDNADWYMTNSATGSASAIMYNVNTGLADSLMFVPGGVEVKFTLANNGDGTFTLKYEVVSLADQEIDLKYTELSMNDEFRYNVFFTVEGFENINANDFGLIIFDNYNNIGTIANAYKIFFGAEIFEEYLVVKTDAISAQYLVDDMYMRAFAKLADGSYVYSDIISYSGVKYANTVLSSKYSTKAEKKLMVSLLNYISAAQKYYGYKTDALANRNLTAEQMNLASYSEVAFSKATSCSDSKLGNFTKQGTGTLVYPTANITGSTYTIQYNLRTDKQVTGDILLYYWTEDVYENAQILTKDNASGIIIMKKNASGVYLAEISGIFAQDIHDTIYVSAVFESSGESFCSGVLAYSVGEYCKVKAQSNSDLQELAQAIAVYGYYAEKYL